MVVGCFSNAISCLLRGVRQMTPDTSGSPVCPENPHHIRYHLRSSAFRSFHARCAVASGPEFATADKAPCLPANHPPSESPPSTTLTTSILSPLMANVVSLLGRYLHHPVVIRVDSTVSQSILASLFALRHSLPRTVHNSGSFISFNATGPVLVPLGTHEIESRIDLLVDYLQGCDVLLGSDWLLACQVTVTTSTLR